MGASTPENGKSKAAASMPEPSSTCPPTAQPNTTPTSRPSTIVSSAGENSPKLRLPPQCENSSSSQTPSCEKIDSGSPDTLDSHHRCSSVIWAPSPARGEGATHKVTSTLELLGVRRFRRGRGERRERSVDRVEDAAINRLEMPD